MTDTEPDHHVADLWPAYLDFYREQVIAGVRSLGVKEQRTSRLASGWTPIELLSHVLHMEQRWFVSAFLAEDVDRVWGDWSLDEPWDEGVDARWQVADDVSVDDLVERLRAVGVRTAVVLATHPLDDVAPDASRFDDDDPATLQWICFHVLQEYARHAGHLDIVVELAEAAREGGPAPSPRP